MSRGGRLPVPTGFVAEPKSTSQNEPARFRPWLRHALARLVLAGRAFTRRRPAAPVWWVAKALSGTGSKGRRKRSQAIVVASALEACCGSTQGPWRVTTVMSSGSALIVARAERPPGSEAVVKLGEAPKAAHEMRLDNSVRNRLVGDPRLSGWCDLLPEVLCSHLGSSPALSIERRRGDADGRHVLAAALPVASAALRSALDAIADLHVRAHTQIQVGDDLVGEWVSEPLSVIASLYRAKSWQAGSLSRLRERLAGVLTGMKLCVGWSHGDYTPANLLFGGADGTALQGVVDWGAGSPHGLLGRDTSLLVITTIMQRRKLDLGAVLLQLLQRPRSLPGWGGGDGARRWGALELLVFGKAPPLAPPTERQGPAPVAPAAPICPNCCAGPVTTLWLAWAQHIATNLTKADIYQKRAAWRVANVDALLSFASGQRLARTDDVRTDDVRTDDVRSDDVRSDNAKSGAASTTTWPRHRRDLPVRPTHPAR
ncbi:MAG TPA: phosphotransferase [Acidimicrobiales bacterium]|nr:phosphotransferase [Acidimicrobiales bacterium]